LTDSVLSRDGENHRNDATNATVLPLGWAPRLRLTQQGPTYGVAQMRHLALCLILLAGALGSTLSIEPNPAITRSTADYVPEVAALAVPASSELRELVERFSADRRELERFYAVPGSATDRERLREFYRLWLAKVQALDFEKLGVEGRIDVTLLRARAEHELRLLHRDAARTREMAALVPFADSIAQLQDARRLLKPVDGRSVAAALAGMKQSLEKARAALEHRLRSSGENNANDKSDATSRKDQIGSASERVAALNVSNVVAMRAAERAGELQQSLREWFRFYDGYDPLFAWWARQPFQEFTSALDDYRKFLREKVAGADPKAKDEPIIGDPIGRQGLLEDLQNEMIAYSPEELIGIAEREFAWVDTELKRAARDMGLGDDWRAALEEIKGAVVEPGAQPALIREFALESTRFVQERGLVTIPPLAADAWQMRMLSPEAQKVNPFFLGGDDILISYPTDTMTQEEKVQSMRANNRHFARAVVFHELLPGHHLQAYWRQRSNPHRNLFSTPFWVEGWALWWEMHLWDLKFTSTPEDRLGALFWRAHRCARIVFSLKFHLGEWTPQQCIDYLVDRVGHERASATGEVRRSFNGSYSPLYQAGYMLGAMQLRALYAQQVVGGKMPEREFHDAILRGGPMPIEMVRALVTKEKLPRVFKPSWRFAE
jgi:hypothetical protein